jgi:hypothetical protein
VISAFLDWVQAVVSCEPFPVGEHDGVPYQFARELLEAGWHGHVSDGAEILYDPMCH